MFWGKRDPYDDYDERYANRPIRERREGPFIWLHLGLLGTAAGILVVAAFSVGDQSAGEQFLKSVASPVGILWALLLLQTYFSFVYRQAWPAIIGVFMWMLLSVAGNHFTKRALVYSLEQPFLNTDPMATEPLDVLFVLGGGATITPAGYPQLSLAGDRVMLAARMFHANKTKLIIVSGTQSAQTVTLDWVPGEETRRLLVQVGVPDEKIVLIQARNTSEELAGLKAWLDQQPKPKPTRIGLITSAWHLPRAMGLAKANGVEAIPIPAQVVTGRSSPNPSMIIPSGENLQWTGIILHEYMGRLIGR